MDPNQEWEINLDVGNILNLFPRPAAPTLAQSPYLLWVWRQPLDSIYFRFDGFVAAPDAIWPDGYSVTYEQELNFWYTGYSSSTNQTKDSCAVMEMYVEPGKVKDHPDGFYQVMINDRTAHIEPWDFPEHPLTMIGYLQMPTILFPRCMAFDLVAIQRELCDYESLIKLHGMTSAVTPIVIDISTIVSEVTGRPDKTIKWRPMSPTSREPHRMESGKLDPGIYEQRKYLNDAFAEISQASNTFRGMQEGGTTAASAISQQRTRAEQMFSKPNENWATGWSEVARKGVKWVQKYYSDAQILEMIGTERVIEVQTFRKAKVDTMDFTASRAGIPLS
jgi:hypothetical protein